MAPAIDALLSKIRFVLVAGEGDEVQRVFRTHISGTSH